MLKTVSSITNAIGALNFKGTWDANANSPALTSSVGVKGDYYVVGTAGATNLNGISNWGVGDLATFNGAVWQRVEGGADLNGVNLSVSGTSTLSGLTASTALALNASKEIVSVTNTGTGDNVLATAPTLVGNVTLSTGNLVVSTSGKGILGTATNNNADTGVVGEFVSSTILQVNRVALTTGTPVNVTSISLTAGDWDVTGLLGLSENSSTAWTYYIGSISDVSGTVSTSVTNNVQGSVNSSTLAVVNVYLPGPVVRVSLASTTTYYLVAQGGFTGGSGQAAFGTISARRVR